MEPRPSNKGGSRVANDNRLAAKGRNIQVPNEVLRYGCTESARCLHALCWLREEGVQTTVVMLPTQMFSNCMKTLNSVLRRCADFSSHRECCWNGTGPTRRPKAVILYGGRADFGLTWATHSAIRGWLHLQFSARAWAARTAVTPPPSSWLLRLFYPSNRCESNPIQFHRATDSLEHVRTVEDKEKRSMSDPLSCDDDCHGQAEDHGLVADQPTMQYDLLEVIVRLIAFPSSQSYGS